VNKKKLALASVALVTLLTVVAFAAFQYGVYYREAELNLDVGTRSIHLNVYLQRAGETEVITIKDGVAINNAGTLADIGANLTAAQLGGTPSTSAHWISLSTNDTSPATGWTEIIDEIVADGLERASGDYALTDVGEWTISHEFTASGTHTDVQLTGLQFAASGDGNLLGADTFTPVTLTSGDKLTVTWTVTVS